MRRFYQQVLTQEQKVAKARASFFSRVRFVAKWMEANPILYDTFHNGKIPDQTDIALVQELMKPERLFRIQPGIIIEAAKMVRQGAQPKPIYQSEPYSNWLARKNGATS
jgi:hypothetical protein